MLGCRRGGCVRSQISFYRKTKVVSFFPSTEGLEYLLSSVKKSDINFPILTERRELSPPTKDFSRGKKKRKKYNGHAPFIPPTTVFFLPPPRQQQDNTLPPSHVSLQKHPNTAIGSFSQPSQRNKNAHRLLCSEILHNNKNCHDDAKSPTDSHVLSSSSYSPDSFTPPENMQQTNAPNARPTRRGHFTPRRKTAAESTYKELIILSRAPALSRELMTRSRSH